MPEITGAQTIDVTRQVRRLEIRARRLVADRLLGQYRSVFRGRGLEFSEVREYQPGDDVRAIDWNVTARMGSPYVKKYVEERELTIVLAVDASASQRFGSGEATKQEIAAEVAGVLAFAAVENNDRVGMLAFTDRIERYVTPDKGSRHVLRLVRDLLSLETAGRGTDIAMAARYLDRVVRRRAVVFLLSDFIDSGYEAPLRTLARRHDVIAITVGDPREAALPAVGMLEAEDAETGERVLLDAGDPRVVASFARQAAGANDARRRQLGALGLDVVELATDRPYASPLLAFFHARARRR
jgi:uncharacterized protein (DUF58 family)